VGGVDGVAGSDGGGDGGVGFDGVVALTSALEITCPLATEPETSWRDIPALLQPTPKTMGLRRPTKPKG
jgi:hypothetical protein